jgi:hypothetical protein
MTRSIFDPGGGETEHSGSTFLGPDGQNASRLPPDLTDGEVAADEAAPPMARDDDEAAQRLREMTDDGSDAADHAGT